MHIDLRTVTIKPLRQTFDHVAARLRGDRPASRYQEGTIRLQAEANFHYRPLWDPEHEIFDPTRTALQIADWYAFEDPRQFYYGTYTLARARMQEAAEADFDFVEQRGLAASLPAAARQHALDVLVPLRHVAWGANMNNSAMCAYGYGTAITQPCLYHAMDQLGIAQYLTRLGLVLGGPAALDVAKHAWLTAPVWQPLRRYVEDSFVVSDWFELFVAQNFALDGLLYPLIYRRFDAALTAAAGPAVAMLVRFQAEWYAETTRWVDASIRTAAKDNQALVSGWATAWRDRAMAALTPIAELALGDGARAALATLGDELVTRGVKLGLST